MPEDASSILIVDDDASIRRTLSIILRVKGYKVDTAATGQEAIQKAREKCCNLVLLDLKLPDMEGTKVLTELHQDMPKVIKIMITGYPSLENAAVALNEGADAYLTKPVSPQQLLTLIKEKLREQRQADKNGRRKSHRKDQNTSTPNRK